MSRKISVAHLSAIAFLTGLLALGCSGSDSVAPSPARVASILFNATVDSVVLGRAYQLTATTQDAQNHTLSGRTVAWTVRDSAVASVSTSGTVMGLQLGTTQVMAQSEGITASLTLNVVRVPVARVQFAVASQMLNVGDSLPVGAIVSDASGAALTDRSVTYVSTGPTVVSVTQDGLLRGIAPGTATVTATTGGVAGQLSVQVRSLPVAQVVITPGTLDLATGVSGALTIATLDVRGNRATATNLLFVSSDPSVATFQAPGRFAALAPGRAVLTVTADGVSGTAPVSVQTLQPGTFHFDLRFVGPPDAAIMAAAQRAAARWERTLPQELASQAVNLRAAACETLAPAIVGTTTGIIVTVAKDSIDGRSKILAEAGPCVTRGNGFPAVGAVSIDSADVASMVQRGTLENVITHELGHVLGIGTIWQDGTRRQLLADTAGGDPRYIGAAAIHSAVDIGFLGADSTRGVEVENVGGAGSRLGHWRESVYSTELMTSIDGPGNVAPLSRITVGSLHDLGYTTRDAGADFFSSTTAKTGGQSISPGVSPSIGIQLRPREETEILRRPRFVATPSGRTVPIPGAETVR